MPRHRRPWVLAVMVLSGFGCGADHLGPESGRIAGQIMTLDTRAPFEGARVVIFSPADNAPVGPVVESDENGQFHLDGIPVGFYYLVIYAGNQVVYEALDKAIPVRAGRTTVRDVLLVSYPLRLAGRTVSGRVTDAVTGLPLAGAFVSPGGSDLPLFFGGTGLPWEAVTDRDGRFVLDHVPTVSTDSGRPVGVTPLVAMKRGYRPGGTGSYLRSEWIPLPPNPADTIHVVLPLEPGTGDFTVTGRLIHEDKPVGGVSVALSYSDTSTAAVGSPSDHRSAVSSVLKPAAVVPDLVDRSDVGGYFEIRHVSPGRYRIHAGYLPDDGWVQLPEDTNLPGDSGLPEVVVREGNVSSVTVNLVEAIRLLSPAPGSSVPTGRPRFTWRSISGADNYLLIFSQANNYVPSESFETPDTTRLADAGLWGSGDYVRWSVIALRRGQIIGSGETIASFSISGRR